MDGVGVRVQGIDPQCPEGMVWQYFSELCDGRSDIADVYYPLLNNNAVVIFKGESAAVKVLTSNHEKWKVLPLPNKVFSKQRVWLEKEMNDLLRKQDHYLEVLKEQSHVEVSVEKGIIMLTGQFYQIEWAWRYLSNLMDQQHHQAGAFRSAPTTTGTYSASLPNGSILSNGDVTQTSARQKSHAGHSSLASPRLQNDVRAQNGDTVSKSGARSLVVEGASGGRHLPSPSSSAAGSPGASPRAQDRGGGASRTKTLYSDVTSLAIEGIADERPASSSGRVQAVTSSAGMEQQERAASSQRRASPMKVPSADMDFMNSAAEEDSGQREPFKSMSSSATGHVHMEDRYSSLPFMRLGVEKESPGQQDSPSQSGSRRGRAFSQTVPSSADLDKAEAIHRAERQHQSMDFQFSALPDDRDTDRMGLHSQTTSRQRHASQDVDDKLGAVGGTWTGGRDDDFDDYDVELRETLVGRQRPFSSLPYTGSSSQRLPLSNYGLLNRSVVELSRRHFDIDQRLKLKIYVDDITRTKTDAVVNAANWELKNIGGVAGALAKAAGPEMEKECEMIYQQRGALRTAEVVKTRAYGKLNHLKYVLHTVGPIYRKEDSDRCVFELAQTFLNSLLMAEKLNLESLTFPFISTGIFGVPVENCVLALYTALKKHGHNRFKSLSTLEEVHFIHNDINVVCNAVLSAEMLAKTETAETCVKRMEDGEKIYSGSVFPFCDRKATPTSRGSKKEERYATWDSSTDKDAAAEEEEERSRSRHRQRSDLGQTAAAHMSLPASAQNSSSSSRGRSHSADRGSKTVTASGSGTKSSTNAKGRDASPMPKPRSRSNSMTSADRGSSGSATKQGGSSAVAATVGGRTQPLIKQSIVPSASGMKKKAMSLAKTITRGRTSDQSGNDTDQSSAAASETEDVDKTCPICLEEFTRPKKLPCGHLFCAKCVDRAMATSPRCPKCQRMFGIPTGTQPRDGKMTYSTSNYSDLPGYPKCGMITINYDFPPGRQEACHPNPGHPYSGTHRTAYLPANQEGQDILMMLQKAFKHRLVFTIGDSVTTGARGVITWNDIHHKTSTYGGPLQFGYPDGDYLFRVREELAAKGITHP